jgi:putative colanic acid biosynthesis acetyltransferase WcaF
VVSQLGLRGTERPTLVVTQRIEVASPISSGNQFLLAGFTGETYGKDRGWPVQVLWLASRSVIMQWWCPNRLRVAVLRAFGARIGAGTVIKQDVKIHWPWKLEIGHDTWIGESTWILNPELVTIGSNTCISQGVLVCSGSHDPSSPTFECNNRPVVIGDSVWIAARATILCGVQLEGGTTVGATALVVRDVVEGTKVVAPQSVVKS